MAPNLPVRYQAQVRLGRDGDIEEWLATDTALDRPVLVRALSPEATRERTVEFLAASREAAGVAHTHLAQVYDVGNHESTAHAILEWTGGVSIADRLAAGEGIPAQEFLPNAAGLAEGLAALHAAGVVHGAIDASAIHFSASHPAKLGGFGRPRVTTEPGMDTADLAVALRAAVTGTTEPKVRPSQVVDGVPRGVDDALDRAAGGDMDAAALASILHAVPARRSELREPSLTWGWVAPATALIVSAMLTALVGLGIGTDPDSPFLFPAAPSPTQAPPSASTTAPVTPTQAADSEGGEGVSYSVGVYDPPPGDGAERDVDLPNLADGDPATSWRTERYFSPLPEIKEGIGLTFQVSDMPTRMAFSASNGTRFQLRWAPSSPSELDEWEELASGTALGPPVELQLPPRDGGVWLLWIVDLPEQDEGVYFTEIGEVAFGT